MPRLDEIRTDYEDQADDLRQLGDEELAAEMEQRALNIDSAIRETRTATAVNLGQAEIRDLPGDTAGTYNIATKGIELETNIIKDPEVLTHVGIHEGKHAQNKREGDEEIIVDVDFEEALTERSTAQVTGEVRAYPHLVHMVDEVARSTGHTSNQVIDLFERGQNAKLNQLYSQAYDDQQPLQEAA